MNYPVIDSFQSAKESGCAFLIESAGGWQLVGKISESQGETYRYCGAYLTVLVGVPPLYLLHVLVDYEPRDKLPPFISATATIRNLYDGEEVDVEVVWGAGDVLVFSDSIDNQVAFANMKKYGIILDNNALSGLKVQDLHNLITNVPDKPVYI